MKKDNSILKEALREIKDAELLSLPGENEIDYEFSEKFEEKSKKLIKKEKQHSSFKRTAKIAVSLIIVSLIGFSLIPNATAGENFFIDFLIKISNNTVFVSNKTEEPGPDFIRENTYTLSVIPDGYVLKKHIISHAVITQVYYHEGGTHISFHQHRGSLSSQSKNPDNNIIVKNLIINSIDVLYIETSSYINAHWKEKDFSFQVTYPKILGEEFLYKNVGNLVLMNSETK